MDAHEKSLWQAAKDDYVNARAIAYQIWGTDLGHDPAAANAITATLLIHHKDLQKQERIHVSVPATQGPTPKPKQEASGALPSACPQCGGPIWDNRTNKKNPKAPDWKCRDKECKDEKGYTTGGWVEKPNPKGAKGGAPVGVAGYNEKPGPLIDDGDDGDLPF